MEIGKDLLITFIVLVILDIIFISFIHKWFAEMIKNVQCGQEMKVRGIPAFLVYPLLASVLYILVIKGAKNKDIKDPEIYLKAGLLGLAIYGTYDLTNLATISGWKLQFALVDMMWGITGFVFTTLITLALIRK